ncbi:conserved hypothetical protein [Thioalkalivibrio sp. K90mix]|jgi:hypothetical protein|uniref:hypothetical protein n=1 Tax=unclassified Thioalkalivibrio TaxID=2621013 RepID=UPI000195A34B|nr:MULTISPECIES: hypothetical protein [unclassified Thioalkalivibrio]ADC71778.1 conserved hypothetical protein [Thioalkalivibrio sp. K90mix]
MTRRVPIEDVRSGHTLATAVHDRSGRLLIPAGMVLQDKQIRVLLSWGITAVEVLEEGADDVPISAPQDAGGPPAAEPTPQMEARADEILSERFQHCAVEDHPMSGIYRLARQALLDDLCRYAPKRQSEQA